MAKHEQRALEMPDDESDQYTVEGRIRNLILPICVLILATVFMMIYTGYQALSADNLPFSILGAFENTTVGISLVFGGVCSIVTASICIFIDKKVSFDKYLQSWWLGAKSMSGAILILCFAWTINTVVKDMKTGNYLASLISDSLPVALLPALLFILGSIMAFATGTSWGTFGIMLPIAAAIASHAAPELMLPCLSAVMAGAVCGDHCSPVSDTTILSSTGAKCNHIDHVTSQLPYSLILAAASFVGFLVLGFTQSGIFGFIATAAALAVLVMVLKK